MVPPNPIDWRWSTAVGGGDEGRECVEGESRAYFLQKMGPRLLLCFETDIFRGRRDAGHTAMIFICYVKQGWCEDQVISILAMTTHQVTLDCVRIHMTRHGRRG